MQVARQRPCLACSASESECWDSKMGPTSDVLFGTFSDFYSQRERERERERETLAFHATLQQVAAEYTDCVFVAYGSTPTTEPRI